MSSGIPVESERTFNYSPGEPEVQVMCARPRETSDEQIFQATARAIGRVGPGKLTLGDVAGDLGIAPATLVQRFGSKRALLLAFARQGAPAGDDEVPRSGSCFEVVSGRRNSPLAKLEAYVAGMAGMARTPQELANHLLFLHTDLTDPEFHRLALRHARATQKQMTALLDEAVACGQLKRRTDTARLARAIQSMVGGSLMGWAILRSGPAARQLREDVEMLLRPYRTRKRS
jgi:AcrR family transcriptional regulator